MSNPVGAGERPLERTRLIHVVGGKNAAALVATAIAMLRGIVIFPIVTKSLPVADYGLWAQLGVISTLIVFVALGGLDVAALRFMAGARKREKDADFTVVSAVAIAFSLVALAACVVVGSLGPIPTPEAREAIGALGLLVVGLVMERLALTQLRRLLLLWAYSGALVALALGDVLAIGGSLASGRGVALTIGAWGAVKIAVGGAVLLASGWRLHALARPRWASITTLLRYGAPFILIAILNWVLNLSDRFLVGWFLGLEDVAYYSASYAVGGLVAFTFGPIFLVAQPLASGHWQDGQREEASRLLWRSLEWGVWLGVPPLVALFAFAPQLLAFFTRSDYVGASLSAGIVAVAIFVQMLSAFAETELGLLRSSTALVPCYAAAAAANVASNVVLLPRIGYIGAALATLVAAVVLTILTHWSVRDAPGWAMRLDRVSVAVASGAIVLAALLLLRGEPVQTTLWVAATSLVGYGALIIFVMRPTLRSVAGTIDVVTGTRGASGR